MGTARSWFEGPASDISPPSLGTSDRYPRLGHEEVATHDFATVRNDTPDVFAVDRAVASSVIRYGLATGIPLRSSQLDGCRMGSKVAGVG